MNILEARRRTLGADVYKKTVQGNPLIVRSLARMRPGLKIMGKSTQKTTNGAQLLNIPDDYAGEMNGVTWVANGGVIHVSGTATNNVYTTNINIIDMLKEGETYYVSGNIGYDVIVYAEIWYNDGTPNDYVQNRAYVVKPNIEKAFFYINVPMGKTVDLDIKPMINKGSTAIPWEPYTGGKPSPSPDYLQEITSAGDDGSIEVDVLGRNLFDPNYQHNFIDIGRHWGGTRTIVDKNVLEWASISDDIGMTRPYYLYPILPNTEYIITFNNTGTQSNWYIGIADSNGIGTRDLLVFGGEEKISFITDENEAYLVLNLTNNFECMLNIGFAALPWEPYKQPQSLIVQTPNGLPGIPVSSGGNYTDENGQQWICDEIDFKRGKYVQRVKERIYGENENVSASEYNTVYTIKQEDADYSTPALSNMFIYTDRFSNDMDFVSLSDYSDSIVFGLSWITGKDKEVAKNWFAQKYAEGNPVKVLYVLAAPIETDLTPEQITAYANLHTNRPTTVVSATDGAGLRLTYKTKKSLEVTD